MDKFVFAVVIVLIGIAWTELAEDIPYIHDINSKWNPWNAVMFCSEILTVVNILCYKLAGRFNVIFVYLEK